MITNPRNLMKIKFRSSLSKLRALMVKPNFTKLLGMKTQRFGLGVYFRVFRFACFWGGRGPKLKNPKLKPVCIDADNRKGTKLKMLRVNSGTLGFPNL